VGGCVVCCCYFQAECAWGASVVYQGWGWCWQLVLYSDEVVCCIGSYQLSVCYIHLEIIVSVGDGCGVVLEGAYPIRSISLYL